MSDKKWTRRAALGLIGTGAGLFAVQTAGFTQIEGVRDANLGSEEDPDGLVGFSAETDVSGNPDERVDLFTLKNNFSDENNSDEPLSINDITINTGDEYDIDDIEIGGERIGQNGPIDIENNATVSGVLQLSEVDEVVNEETKFEISASQGGVLFELDRFVTVTIQEFYSNPVNYSDNRERGRGTAPQPSADDAKGVVNDVANIGRDNEDVATIDESEQGDGNVSVRAGFRLRSVGSEDCYTLTIRTADAGGGNLRAYIVNENGDELTRRRRIEGNNDYSFKIDGEENEDDLDGIGDADSLFLLFRGEGNQSHEIKFINFEAGCGS